MDVNFAEVSSREGARESALAPTKLLTRRNLTIVKLNATECDEFTRAYVDEVAQATSMADVQSGGRRAYEWESVRSPDRRRDGVRATG